jgi:hypothetical protein
MQQNPSSDATGRYHDEGNPGISYRPNFQGMFTIRVYSHIQKLFHIQSQTVPKNFLQFNVLAILRFRRLVAGLSQRTPEFDSRQIHVGFGSNEVTLG